MYFCHHFPLVTIPIIILHETTFSFQQVDHLKHRIKNNLPGSVRLFLRWSSMYRWISSICLLCFNRHSFPSAYSISNNSGYHNFGFCGIPAKCERCIFKNRIHSARMADDPLSVCLYHQASNRSVRNMQPSPRRLFGCRFIKITVELHQTVLLHPLIPVQVQGWTGKQWLQIEKWTLSYYHLIDLLRFMKSP